MLTLRFSFDVEFDSTDTAKAYGVALGFALNDASRNALDISEAPAPRLERGKIEGGEVLPADCRG